MRVNIRVWFLHRFSSSRLLLFLFFIQHIAYYVYVEWLNILCKIMCVFFFSRFLATFYHVNLYISIILRFSMVFTLVHSIFLSHIHIFRLRYLSSHVRFTFTMAFKKRKNKWNSVMFCISVASFIRCYRCHRSIIRNIIRILNKII